jgi:hypothetical protein
MEGNPAPHFHDCNHRCRCGRPQESKCVSCAILEASDETEGSYQREHDRIAAEREQ